MPKQTKRLKPITKKKPAPHKRIPKKKTARKVLPPVVKTIAMSEESKLSHTFPIVGIGASAGGLEAIEQFFTHTPSNLGIAFVIIVHLSATQKSIMGDLVKKYTQMKVFQIEDKMELQPNCIYITPPSKDIAILNGILHLMDPVEVQSFRLPIDYFFRSLAEDQRENAVGIILSGTGTDGTMGLKAIKGEGGMAMVQDPVSAKYDGMPNSAIATGLIDYVLPATKMAEQLIKYIKHSFFKKIRPTEPVAPIAVNYLEKIFILLRKKTGHDFSHYKTNTIYRRVQRRMAIHQIEKIAEYVAYLQQGNKEAETLFKEILIGVTNFFRDTEAFDTMKKSILPKLLQNVPAEKTIRIWVPGCSTGEEAFSLAIIFKEYMESARQKCPVQIFATDIDTTALEIARKGAYPNGIAIDVSPARLKKYFTKEENGYKIKKSIREMVIFAVHDVTKDPPFSKLHLISCRNLLIYLGPEIQKKIISSYHYALNHDGILFLGTSETIGQSADLYSVIDRKWKFFKNRKTWLKDKAAIDNFPQAFPYSGATKGEKERIGEKDKNNFHALTQSMLLKNYAPPCVIINRNYEILYVRGRTGKYLEPAAGEAKMNILDMAREGLKYQLSVGIHTVFSKKKDVACRGVQIKDNGGFITVDISIKPISDPKIFEGLTLIVFEEKPAPEKIKVSGSRSAPGKASAHAIKQLQKELHHTKEYLQTTIEELETSNEELKSLNEELQSSNEELQSTNEELETSKEELQSVNEELVTVNSEFQSKIDELMLVSNDMVNLITSTEIATIFLDTNLCIKRFTPQAGRIINLIKTDIDRPLSHIVSNLHYEKLIADIETVLETLVPKEIESQSHDGCWYLIRILPYRTLDNIINGIVITFLDITGQKKAAEEINESRLYAENIAQTVHEPFLILNEDLRVLLANESFYQTFKVIPEKTVNEFVYNLGNRQWNIPALRELLENLVTGEASIKDFKVEHDFEAIGHKTIVLNARPFLQKSHGKKFIFLAFNDVTEFRRKEEQLLKTIQELERKL